VFAVGLRAPPPVDLEPLVINQVEHALLERVNLVGARYPMIFWASIFVPFGIWACGNKIDPDFVERVRQSFLALLLDNGSVATEPCDFLFCAHRVCCLDQICELEQTRKD
jgi:hypothetical protein